MRLKQFLHSHSEVFLLLLPFYFAFHGYILNKEAMTWVDMFSIFGDYVLLTVIILGLFFLLLNSFRKSALFTFTLLFFYLFFGAIHDALKKVFPDSFFLQYGFVIPFSLLFFILLFFYLLFSKRKFTRISTYLNIVFILLIAVDIPNLFKKDADKSTLTLLPKSINCTDCDKPNIYLIIADEYADSSSLQQIFNFNNGGFQSALRDRGFFVHNKSRSNYNFTPFAMASLLQMNYLTGIVGRNQNLSDRNHCYELVNNTALWNFFKDNGYDIKNHSLFNIANIPSPAPQSFLLLGKHQVEAQTFLARINRDIRFNLLTRLKLESEVKRYAYFMNECNQTVLKGLLEETEDSSSKPKFVYTHITMPHYPYYFDKEGTPYPLATLEEGQQTNKKHYMEYLQYSNTILLAAIDRILKNSSGPPIIILMGDHGFREFENGFEEHAPFYYMNLNAVLLPNRNYAKFYEGISSVNQFRVLLNSAFKQNFPLLRDSTVLIHE